MKLRTRPLLLSGSYEIQSDPVVDQRGSFARIFCQQELININKAQNILQMNLSFSSKKGTIRGMHYQRSPYQEDKLVRCLKGSIFDVLVDMRINSPTYGDWVGLEISEHKSNSIYVPKGFAHGFQTLENNCEVLYCHTEVHVPDAEAGFSYACSTVGIQWPLEPTHLSERDKNLPKFERREK